MDREIVINWIYKASELDLDDELFIPGETKDYCKKMIKRFNKELDIFYTLDPEKAGTIIAVYGFRDSRHWIILKRTLGSPLMGFVKKATGEKERVVLKHDPEREKKIKLMIKEGLSLEEIEAEMGSLSLEEKFYFEGKGKGKG